MKSSRIIISILALANIVCVPVFDVWGGLFPKDVEDNFFEVMEYVFEGEFDYWVVVFTLSILIPSLFMLFFSFSESAALFKVSAGAGVLALGYTLVRFVGQYEIDYLFDFEDGNISIGTWISLALFIIALIAVKNTVEKPSVSGPITVPVVNDAGSVAQPQTLPANKFCSQCGKPIDVSFGFCGHCGNKIN